MTLQEIKETKSVDKLYKLRDVASDYLRDLRTETQATEAHLAEINQRIKQLSGKD